MTLGMSVLVWGAMIFGVSIGGLIARGVYLSFTRGHPIFGSVLAIGVIVWAAILAGGIMDDMPSTQGTSPEEAESNKEKRRTG